MASWQTFYPSQARPIEFAIEEVEITASNEVACATGIGRCAYIERDGEKTDLKFRLTIGFRKREGQWRILHEHHSVPATD
jgi:ketosteroid isomerase-like protein